MTEILLSSSTKKDYQIICENFIQIATVITLLERVEPDQKKIDEKLQVCFENSGFIGSDGNLRTIVTKSELLLANLGSPGTDEQLIQTAFSKFYLPLILLVFCLSLVGYENSQGAIWILLRLVVGSSLYCLLAGSIKYFVQKRHFNNHVTTSMMSMHTSGKTITDRISEHGFPRQPLIAGIVGLALLLLEYIRSFADINEGSYGLIFFVVIIFAWAAISWISKKWSSEEN